MTITVCPQTITRTIDAPASKSAVQRAIALALLTDGETRILKPTYSNDVRAAASVAKSLGAEVEMLHNEIIIRGKQREISENLSCGEAGLCIRMFAPVAALFGKSFKLSGEGSLLVRPVAGIQDALEKFGAVCETSNGFPPLKISGKLLGGKADIDGSLSSQVLTGLLIALPTAEQDSEIFVPNLKSKPYIALTLDMIRAFGGDIENTNFEHFKIKGNQTYKALEYQAEGDWSGAAFLLVAGLISGEITVTNLDLKSSQADRAILEAIGYARGNMSITFDGIITRKTQNLEAFDFDATDCPDLFPPLVALAAYCKGTSRIKGVSRLAHKESNRGEVLRDEFAKIGIKITLDNDLMHITGGTVWGGHVRAHNDHRIAMATAAAALGAKGEIAIDEAESINKSYPDFFRDLGI